MTMSTVLPCDRLVELMPDLLDDPELLSVEETDHVAQCLRCQAEMARFRRLRRTLASFGEIPVAADPAILDGSAIELPAEGPPPLWGWPQRPPPGLGACWYWPPVADPPEVSPGQKIPVRNGWGRGPSLSQSDLQGSGRTRRLVPSQARRSALGQ
jgi:hypothetical protein